MPAVKPMLITDVRGKLDPVTHTHQYTVSQGLDLLPYPLYASDKLDGMRLLTTMEQPQTRSGEGVPNHHVRKLLSTLPAGLDGELCVEVDGVPNFKQAMGDLRRHEGEPEFTYRVFDLFDHAGPYWARLEALGNLHFGRQEWCSILPQTLVHTAQEVRDLFAERLDFGMEGLCLTHPDGFYKAGKAALSKAMRWKVKPWDDTEGEVVGWFPRRHNGNEAQEDAFGRTKRSSHMENRVALEEIGGWMVRHTDYPEPFPVSPVGTRAERQAQWIERETYRGQMLRFQYVTVGGYSVPRHATAQGFRPRWDMDAPSQRV